MEAAGYGSPKSRCDLERRIEEAQNISVACTPGTLVTMNSTVVLVEVSSGERRTCTLVYPEDRDLIPHSVGVLQQSGQCILGRSVGDIVQMTEGAKTRRFRIESIVVPAGSRRGRHTCSRAPSSTRIRREEDNTICSGLITCPRRRLINEWLLRRVQKPIPLSGATSGRRTVSEYSAV